MYHQRSSFSFGGDSASQNVNVLRSGHHQNENLIHRGSSLKPSVLSNNNNNNNNGNDLAAKKPLKSLSKTPHGKSTSTRRRAFGDISNKKANNHGLSSSAKRNTSQPSEVLKPLSNNLLPRSIRKAPATRFAILPEQPKPIAIQQKPVATSKATSQRTQKAETYPDIERPAGRTWKQQLEYDLKDEDDLASLSSVESFLEFQKNSGKRWQEERDLRYKQQQEKYAEEDRQVRAQMEAMMDREEQEAQEELDSLYEVFDDLELFSTHSDTSTHDDLSGFDLGIPDDLFPL